MLTPSFPITATERILPKLALDFTTANLDSRITFTRTTSASNPATYIDSSGVIVAATNNQPRFDYNPVSLACNGLLIEESRTNLLTYSRMGINTSGWSINGTATRDFNEPAPDGTTDAVLFTDTDASSAADMRQAVTVANNSATYTLSVFSKAGSTGILWIRPQLTGGTASFANIYFTFSTKTFSGVPVGWTASYSEINNNWYRISITFSNNSTGNTTLTSRFGSTTTTVGETGSVYLWGAQLEAGAFPTSYIPTEATALTRNADVATMTGTNFSDWWTATNGASDIWLIPKSTSTLAYMSFDDNTANNSIIIANSTISGQSTITSSGSLQSTLTAGTITANATNKVGCSWNTNNCAATANGTSPATTASATIPTVTQLRIGSNGTAYANAWIQKLFYWSQRITNNEIQAFTK